MFYRDRVVRIMQHGTAEASNMGDPEAVSCHNPFCPRTRPESQSVKFFSGAYVTLSGRRFLSGVIGRGVEARSAISTNPIRLLDYSGKLSWLGFTGLIPGNVTLSLLLNLE